MFLIGKRVCLLMNENPKSYGAYSALSNETNVTKGMTGRERVGRNEWVQMT